MEKVITQYHDEVPSDSLQGSQEQTWTEEEERAVRRKLDYHVVPMVTIMYLLCFIDRTNIGNARIQGMAEELKLNVGYRFNWVLTTFYLAYIVVEIPSNIALKKVGARVWLPFLTVAFGTVCVGTAFARTFGQLIVLRLLLGLTEGGMMPGTSFYLSCFYKREELLFRIGIFASSASMAGAFGGLMATGLTKIPKWGAHGSELHTWRNIFFFEGLITMVVGGLAPLMLPRNPETCSFLNEREKSIAVGRLALESKGDPHESVTWPDVKRAVLNINNTFCAIGFLCANVAVQSISLFMPTILKDMGYKPISAQLHSVPPYAIACIVAIIVAYASDRTRQRGIYLVLFAAVAVIGYAMLRTVKDAHTKYAAVFLVALGAFPNGPGFLSWGINNAAGPAIRAVTSGYIMSIGTLGAVIATWTYVDKDKPLYPVGHSINLGFQALLMAIAASCTVYCHYENRQRDQGKRDSRLSEVSEAEEIKLGYRHPAFRYIP